MGHRYGSFKQLPSSSKLISILVREDYSPDGDAWSRKYMQFELHLF